MKTKIVYCLVSDSKDYYYEQLLISLCSLRKHNSDAEVEVVCDRDTFATLVHNRRGIFEYNIHVIPIDTPIGWRKKERSRYLKTNLRKLIDGDYLFLDTDTVICSSLEFIDDFPFEIGAVYDSHVERPLPKYSQCKYKTEYWIWGEAKKIGVNIEGLWHFNSGVFFVRDTPKAYDLYTRWFNAYQKQLEDGVKIDQLPLLLSNREMDNIIYPLDSNMNNQVSYGGINLNIAGAKIIHYFPTQKATLLSSPWILDPIKEIGRITASVNNIIEEPYNFFKKKSRAVVGDAVSLLDTPSLLTAYMYSHKMFAVFATLLDLYVRAKRNIHKAVSFARK